MAGENLFGGTVIGVIGLTAATFGIFVAMFLVATFNWSIGFILNARTQVVMTGGLTAFICLGWITEIRYNPLSYDSSFGSGVALLIVLFGMLHGQLGGLWSARRNESWFGYLAINRRKKNGQPKQLRLANLFGVTFLLAIAFAIQRATSFPVARAVVVYIVLQTILIGVDVLWIRIRQQRHQLLNKSHANG